MNKTKIEWVKNPDGGQGYTWNPITGCLNGCPYCYARRLANGRLKQRYLANGNYAPMTVADIDNPFYPRLWPERLATIFRECKGEKAKGIFVCDMGELFGDWVPEEWQDMVFTCIRAFPQHRFYLLTKQPQNLTKFSPFPGNCYVGVTATGTKMYWEALAELQYIKASVKYVSIEPFLEPIKPLLSLIEYSLKKAGIGWIILGSQTKPYKPPKIEWVEAIVQAADEAGTAVFLKDNLLEVYAITGETGVRQEMPVIGGR